MKTIGIIGGLGPQATIDFEKQIHSRSQKLISQHENQGYPQMITWYLRHPPMKLGEGGRPQIPLEPHPHLLEVARILGSQADFLTIPSNTPHLFLQAITKAAGCEVLNIVDLVIEELIKRSAKRVGVLAIGFTLENGLYQKRLVEEHMTSEIIPSEIAIELDKAIFAVMEGRCSAADVGIATEAVDYLRDRKKVDSIIIGCSEIPLLLQKGGNKDLINPVELLADAAVKHALS